MITLKKIRPLLFVLFVLILSACNSGDKKTFSDQFSVKPDTLQIDNTKDTLLFGSKGTGLFFEKESFVMPDGSSPKGKISIHLKESYSLVDMIRENLSSTSNGKLLETRGMIQVQAFSDNQQLQLKEGKKFIIHFPKDSIDMKKQMNLFYGQTNSTENINWTLDSLTLLRPTAFINGWMTTGWPGGDSTRDAGFYFKGQKEIDISEYFYKTFDNTKLEPNKELIDKEFEAKFTVTKLGKIINVRIEEEIYDSSGKKVPSKTKPDPYFYQYIQQLPALEPFYFYNGDKLVPFDAESSFNIRMGFFPPDYQNKESYNKLFSQKYSAFKNSSITSINDAELNYYVFSSSKLGWINCDFFWKVNDEKIDYIVKVDPESKPNIKLVFTQVKSIMAGTLKGDKYIFENVPINQDVRLVAISFKGSEPLLSVSETKTSKEIFDKFDFKEFSLSDLEKQFNKP